MSLVKRTINEEKVLLIADDPFCGDFYVAKSDYSWFGVKVRVLINSAQDPIKERGWPDYLRRYRAYKT